MKTGLSPGTPVYTGEKKRNKTIAIEIFDYNGEKFTESEFKDIADLGKYNNAETVTWINVDGIHDVEIIKQIAEQFKLHPLVVEDIVNIHQRPKVDHYGEYVYIVLKMVYYNKQNELTVEQVSMIVGKNLVITFQEAGKDGDVFATIRDCIRSVNYKIRTEGADFLAYSIIDAIVDNYFNVLEIAGQKLEDMEDSLITDPSKTTLNQFHEIKSELVFLRQAIWPMREVINNLQRISDTLIKGSMNMYFSDVYDHVIQIVDSLELYREMTSEMVDIYLSSLSNRLNEVMKTLTIIATIFMPLTFIVGLYGMNFHYIPELNWHYGYPAVWGVIVIVTVAMMYYFKRRRWM